MMRCSICGRHLANYPYGCGEAECPNAQDADKPFADDVVNEEPEDEDEDEELEALRPGSGGWVPDEDGRW